MRTTTAVLLTVTICHITLISSSTSSPTCNNNGHFGNQSYFSEFHTHARYFIGRPEVCTSVGYTPVCRDSLTQTFMERFCQYVQSNSRPVDSILIGSLSDYIDGYTTQYAVTNVTCPPSSNDCTYQINQTNCSDYGGIAVFSCLTDECNGDGFRLQDTTYVEHYTGSKSTTGRLTACLNNEYVDICADDVSSSSFIAVRVCGSSYSSYSYQPWSSQYGISNSGVVLTNFSCNDSSSSLDECTYNVSSIDQCHSGLLIISCNQECSSGFRVVNQEVSYSPNGTYLTGHLETCVNNRWVSVCDNGSLPDVLAKVSCGSINQLNQLWQEFTDGIFIQSSNDTDNNINVTFYTGFSCSDNAIYYSQCVPRSGLTQTNSSQCSHATIQCYRSNECSSYSPDYLLLPFNSYVASNYISGDTGRPEFCINNQLTTFCNNTLNSHVTSRVCNHFFSYYTFPLYSSGVPYPIVGSSEDYGVNLVNNNFITSITCPMDGFGLHNCNITTGDTCDTPAGVITCFNGCLKYQTIYKIFVRYNGEHYFGYAAVCDGSGNNVIPICRNDITDEHLRFICIKRGLYYGFLLVQTDAIKDPAIISDTVAINISCSVFSKINECKFSTGNTCDDRGGFALMSCINYNAPHMCNHGDVRITGGPNSYTGRPEFCYFGTWRTICGNEYYQADAAVTCQMAGFNHDGAVNVTGGMYGGNGMSPVLAGLRCVTGREGYFSNCNPINGDLLSTCDPSMAAAVQCEPLIVSMKTIVSVSPSNANITCNAHFDQISLHNYILNSIDWYHNGHLITNVSNRYNLIMSSFNERHCYFTADRYLDDTCDNINGVRLVLQLEMLQMTDAGEYTCIVNITDLGYDRNIVNKTTEVLVLQVPPTPSITLNYNSTILKLICTANSSGYQWTDLSTGNVVSSDSIFYTTIIGSNKRDYQCTVYNEFGNNTAVIKGCNPTICSAKDLYLICQAYTWRNFSLPLQCTQYH